MLTLSFPPQYLQQQDLHLRGGGETFLCPPSLDLQAFQTPRSTDERRHEREGANDCYTGRRRTRYFRSLPRVGIQGLLYPRSAHHGPATGCLVRGEWDQERAKGIRRHVLNRTSLDSYSRRRRKTYSTGSFLASIRITYSRNLSSSVSTVFPTAGYGSAHSSAFGYNHYCSCKRTFWLNASPSW